MDDQFKIQIQFEAYLNRVKLDKTKMPPVQYTALRRAFFGAFSQMMVLMQGAIPDLPEIEGIKVLESMTLQCKNFWINEIGVNLN
jgi:hypothetical protein